MRPSYIKPLVLRPSAFIDGYISAPDTTKRQEIIDLFEKIHDLFPNVLIMTCPIMHPDIHYVSRNTHNSFGGIDFSLMYRNTNWFFNQVHEADRTDVNTCLLCLHDYFETIPSAEHADYRGVLYYRFRKTDGQYMYLQDEKAVMKIKESGNLYCALIRDITADKRFEGVKLEIYKSHEPGCRIREFRPTAQRKHLTKRENDLVSLIKQGLSTKEIAWYLKISHHTVRNTKSKLFEKFKVNNTIELLNMTSN